MSQSLIHFNYEFDIVKFREKFPRVLGMNTFDLAGTALFALLVQRYTKHSFPVAYAEAFAIGEMVHIATNTKTPVTQKLS